MPFTEDSHLLIVTANKEEGSKLASAISKTTVASVQVASDPAAAYELLREDCAIDSIVFFDGTIEILTRAQALERWK
jgi:hypothetical protein